MLNRPEFYQHLGRMAAEARNQHDEARAQFHKDHFVRARRLEQPTAQHVADSLYHTAYREARRP